MRVCAIISHNDYYNQDKTKSKELLLHEHYRYQQ